MLDNGAYSKWKRNKPTNWEKYYRWCEEWLQFPTTWAVIPDVIDGGAEQQDQLLSEWSFGQRGAPVWHMDEPLDRLLRLCDEWAKVCIGSTSVYSRPLSPQWQRRMDLAFEAISKRHRFIPWLHMLRGLACVGKRWIFASADSADIARNHKRPQNSPQRMAQRWDVVQCERTFIKPPELRWTAQL